MSSASLMWHVDQQVTGAVIGILYIYEGSGPRVESVASINFATAYFSICLALNVVLTLMIVTRLIMHVRGLRKTTGAPDGSGGLYTVASTVVTMLIESYALYAAALLLYIVPWALNSWVLGPFSKAPGPIQVRAVTTFPRCAATFGCRRLIVVPRR
jgi:hypothetical protein